MRNLLYALFLLIPGIGLAQQQQIYCNKANQIPCNNSSQIGLGTQGDPTWLSFGKVNANESQLYSLVGQNAAAGVPFLVSPQFGLPGYGVGGGFTSCSPQGDANWNVCQTSIPYNPTEWQIYSNAAQGIVQVIGGTNQVVLVSGTSFSSSWVSLPYFYFNGSGFKVLAVTDSSHLTVQTTTGGTVTWGGTANGTYFFTVTSSTSTCNVIGTAVTQIAGQPFIPFIDFLYINGAKYGGTVTWNSTTSLTLSSSPGNASGATCIIYKNIAGGNGAGELSNIRLQALAGSSEENFVITETPNGAVIQTAIAGSGQYRPISIGDGELPAGSMAYMLQIVPNGTMGDGATMSLGGAFGAEAMRVPSLLNQVNYWLAGGNATGLTPYLACRGSDSTVGCDIDTQGANTTTFSSHTFSNTEFQIFGNGGTSWLGTGSSSSANPSITANGSATNINVVITPKGTATAAIGSVGVQMTTTYSAAGTPLPTCTSSLQNTIAVVSDATATVTYRGTYTSGGSVRTLVFCDGSNWTTH